MVCSGTGSALSPWCTPEATSEHGEREVLWFHVQATVAVAWVHSFSALLRALWTPAQLWTGPGYTRNVLTCHQGALCEGCHLAPCCHEGPGQRLLPTLVLQAPLKSWLQPSAMGKGVVHCVWDNCHNTCLLNSCLFCCNWWFWRLF